MGSATARLNRERALDEYLVASAKLGERAAMEQLARRWHPKLVAHAWRLTGEREMAREAAQNAWREILRGIRGLQDDRAFAAWAYRIVSRSCAREIGSAVRERDLKAAVAAEPHDLCAAPDEPAQTEPLRQAIRQLPAGERAAIALYHFEDMRVAEVAVALAIPAGTVKTRLMNARRKLRAILEGDTP
ncbi:sigma-70 family RNA polymerase sigma factor [Altererythrobacter luteolus]|uniref:Sigma-70 family RNA polymerase sigma factor n=1 Tax=Pontixanthobacter luteolus TaxID=295089 RepID=A0A6I4V5Q1_9SPHN|nr:sigma-70 family RNA polymerase sigma factor [Pontixanthobacter luteolus]MXP47624.1 sigma-70 family RNA polymerase sigma factor [Pontixanthobacter luteolus]